MQFPGALALASLGGEVRHHALMGSFAALYGLCLAMFVTAHPLF